MAKKAFFLIFVKKLTKIIFAHFFEVKCEIEI